MVVTSYSGSLTHRKFPSCTLVRTQEQNQTGINRLSPLKLTRMKKLASEVLATQSLCCVAFCQSFVTWSLGVFFSGVLA